jgi:hypothetical protein
VVIRAGVALMVDCDYESVRQSIQSHSLNSEGAVILSRVEEPIFILPEALRKSKYFYFEVQCSKSVPVFFTDYSSKCSY